MSFRAALHGALWFLLVAALAGCASSKSGSAYTRDQARQEMHVRLGIVESVREVTLEGTAIAIAAGATSPTTAPTASSANAPTDGGGGALGWLSLFGLSSFLALGSVRRRLS